MFCPRLSENFAFSFGRAFIPKLMLDGKMKNSVF